MSMDWNRPRNISVVVDNPSWILPFAEQLVAEANANGDNAALCRSHDEIEAGAIAFYLGCERITPPDVLAHNTKNLVVHASALPKGRGFSPLTWLTIEGKTEIPVCLIEADEAVDAGPVVFKKSIRFKGHELLREMQEKLGEMTVALCADYLNAAEIPSATPQRGEATEYPRRRPADSEIDPALPLFQHFDLLRTVDNGKYPAFFKYRGHAYKLTIEKMPDGDDQ